MVKKHFTRRLTVASFLAFLSVVFASFSCQDHEVPEQPQQPELAKINTLSAVYGGATNIFSYTVQFEDLGDFPVTEYGIVSYAGETDESHAPDVPAAPYVYPFPERQFAFAEHMPATLNAVTITRPYDQGSGFGEGITRLFYRAYAILSNNAVVYGEVKYVDFIKNEDAIIKPVIKTLDASKGNDINLVVYSLQFESLGNIPILEYGTVIYEGKQNEQQTPEVPVNNPLEKNYPYSGTADLSPRSIIREYDGPTDGPIRLFYRAYAILNNGEVVYGEVKFLDFEILVKPVIQTVSATASPLNQSQTSITFNVKFDNLGNISIFQYGLIFDLGVPGNSKFPDFPISSPDEFYRFIEGADPGDGPALENLDLNLKSKTVPLEKAAITFRVFYRAYAKLSNGEFVYGGVKFIDVIP